MTDMKDKKVILDKIKEGASEALRIESMVALNGTPEDISRALLILAEELKVAAASLEHYDPSQAWPIYQAVG